MTGRRKKSGKRSAASSTRRLSRRPPTFFIDECLGGHHLAAVLTAEGVDVKLARSEFAAGTPDAVWLPVVGERGWVVLTKDRHIRRRELEIQALVRARVRAFVLTAADLTGAEQAAVFVRALPKMLRICQGSRGLLIGAVGGKGGVRLLSLPRLRTPRRQLPRKQ